MEEAAKVIGGITGELVFFVRSFFLGFVLRMCYDPLILLRKTWHHPRWLVNLQDALYWMAGSLTMFGLLFRENNGTPRLFAIAGILTGMLLYQLGPGRLTIYLYQMLLRRAGRVIAGFCRVVKKIGKKG